MKTSVALFWSQNNLKHKLASFGQPMKQLNKFGVLCTLPILTCIAFAGEHSKAATKAPVGTFACVVVGEGEYFDIASFELKPDGSYETSGGSKGKYTYTPGTSAIKFLSGHYAEAGVNATYHANGPVKGGVAGKTDPVIVLTPKADTPKSGSGHSEKQYCYKQKKPSAPVKPQIELPKAH